MTISEVKSTARKTLSGKFKNVLGIMALYTLINFSLQYISNLLSFKNSIIATLLSVFFSFIQIFFGYGLVSNLIKLSKQSSPIGYTDFITDAVANIPKVFKIILGIFIRLLLPTIVFSILLYIEIYFYGLAQNNNTYILPSLACFVLLVISVIFLISVAMNYVFSLFCLVDENNKTINELLLKSKSLIKGNKIKYILLSLSFIIYFILIIIIASIFAYFVNSFMVNIIIKILTMFITPYLTISQYIFYEELLPISND